MLPRQYGGGWRCGFPHSRVISEITHRKALIIMHCLIIAAENLQLVCALKILLVTTLLVVANSLADKGYMGLQYCNREQGISKV